MSEIRKENEKDEEKGGSVKNISTKYKNDK
jgi:hypothetical protein